MMNLRTQSKPAAACRASRVRAAHGSSPPCSRTVRASRVACRANFDDLGINLNDYHRAEVQQVSVTGVKIPVALIRLHNEANQIMPLFLGELEANALLQEMNKRTSPRPMTHDLSRDLLDLCGYKVKLTAINRLVGNTYHSRMFMESHDGKHTWDVDARPSDSINFALRFDAPLYVHSTIAAKMALANGGSFTLAQSSGLLAESESQQAIIESCRAECALHSDPLVVERMRMDLAVAQERFQDAIELRDKIDREVQRDMSMRLIANIDAALTDHRFEEAARMRDELRARRLARNDRWYSTPERL